MNTLSGNLRLSFFSLPKAGCRFSSTKTSEALRILFCGSDEFSIASLRALHNERLKENSQIASIDVVCRPPKRTGRGFKTVHKVPIQDVAEKLNFPVHNIDTFTGWKPPTPQDSPINLVIAVSFGLLVPPRILNGAAYGGLNVHPSLLPDFKGPAPIQHTLLQRRTHTGITLQTLHPKHFDHGTRLLQTPSPGFQIPEPETITPEKLTQVLAELGSRMLVDGIRNRVYVPPHEDTGWYSSATSHAPKITKEHRRVDWQKWTAEEIILRKRVLGDLWDDCLLPDGKRLILHDLNVLAPSELGRSDYIARPGKLTKGTGSSPMESSTFVATCDEPARFIRIHGCTIEGQARGTGATLAKFAAE